MESQPWQHRKCALRVPAVRLDERFVKEQRGVGGVPADIAAQQVDERSPVHEGRELLQRPTGFAAGRGNAFVGAVIVVDDRVEGAAGARIEIAGAILANSRGITHFAQLATQQLDHRFAAVERPFRGAAVGSAAGWLLCLPAVEPLDGPA